MTDRETAVSFPWYRALAIYSFVLVAFDAVFTWYYLTNDHAVEGNPMLAFFIAQAGTVPTLVVRTLLVLVGIMVLAEYAYLKDEDNSLARVSRIARTGLWVIFGVYLLVNVYHVLGGILVSQ